MSFSRLDKPWARTRAAGGVREVLLLGVLGPLMDLYNVAGVNTHCPSDPAMLLRANVEGTEAAFREAQRLGVRSSR